MEKSNPFTNLLIIENSARGFNWMLKITNSSTLEEHLAKINPNVSEKFFNKSILEYWPQQGDILDLEKGIETIADCLKHNKIIGIVGDYDVDGSSATALLINYFKQIGINFIYHIPNRFTEGYGVSPIVLEKIIKADVFITVDNGTTAYEAIDFIKNKGKKMIILDHHHLQNPIEIDAFINPHRQPNGFEILCATGLVFIFLVELNKYLYENKLIQENINVFNYIDMAAVATVCDVMPLVGINRPMVALGIKKLKMKPRPGFKAMLKNTTNIDVQTIGFYIGPCINAAGRLETASKAVDFLIEENEEKAAKFAEELVSINCRRKEIEKNVMEQAEKQINALKLYEKPSITVFGDFFEGVIGIIAGRIKEKYNKPCCVLSENDGKWKGSLRSVEGFHVGNLVKNAINEKIVSFGGGHEMAGGLTMEKTELQNFMDYFDNAVQSTNLSNKKEIFVDTLISLSALKSTVDLMEKYAPFGPGNPEFLVMIPNCYVSVKRVMEKCCLVVCSNSDFKYKINCWLFISQLEIIEYIKPHSFLSIVGYLYKKDNNIEIKLIDCITSV